MAIPPDPSLVPRESDLTELLGVVAPPEPADFAAFWRATLAETLAIPPEPSIAPSKLRVDGFDVFDVSFTSLGRLRIHGWLTTPRDRPVTRGLVINHGYGGREGPDALPMLPDAAMIFPCARGLSLSRQSGLPAEAATHVLHGLAARETYIHRGCAADVWAAASALTALVPVAATRLDYVGTSFGGGIGALALPWDTRFKGAFLGLPSFGQHPLRLQIPSTGSGESVRLHVQRHPEAVEVLRYFDASIAARHLSIPVLVAAALSDPMVPPPGQFAVYNALPGPRELLLLQAGHLAWPGAAQEEAAMRAALIRFLTRPSP